MHQISLKNTLSPALATIYIGQLEEAFLSSRIFQPVLWVRYIDDIFLVWAHPLKEFNTFLSEINSIEERINFTAEVFEHSCNFLDLTIYKSPQFETTRLLSTKI